MLRSTRSASFIAQALGHLAVRQGAHVKLDDTQVEMVRTALEQGHDLGALRWLHEL
ncbi:hypothetical protein [Streptomyces sp. NPDC046942]|uniref:hypothetical protein n=1 Tax=Streptomyces sp. NPDC046942 TaxID=3155137 RepID=UPI0033FE90FF